MKATLKEKRPIVWKDAEKPLEAVLKEQKVIEYYVIKVMTDGDQGFLKIYQTVLLANCLSESDCGVDDLNKETDSNFPMKRRSLYLFFLLCNI